MKLVEELKSSSSKWIKGKADQYRKFYWQRGYGSFSIHPNEVPGVTHYIQNQRIHHNNVSFKDEYLSFLKDYEISYDERYVWD